MTDTTLQIKPRPSANPGVLHFVCVGSIDVSAVPVLEPLYTLPANCSIELDFTELERINSMGLAQLLKLFEHWQKQNSTIKIFNVNRMITVLFKMTGLTRFLSLASNDPPTNTRVAAAPGQAKVTPAPSQNPSAPFASLSAEKNASTPSLTTPNHDSGAVQAKPPLFSSEATLTVQPDPSKVALAQTFAFAGMIDVHAIPVLATLYVLPAQCQVTLDFTQLQRVNSMGLAQLLKLFEHWQKQAIAVRIINVNRMVEVLFKMTGLTRFLTDGFNNPQEHAATVPAAAVAEASKSSTARLAPSVAAGEKQGKLNLWISAQSSQQMNGWYFFNTYLQRHLRRDIHPEIIHGAINERLQKRDDQMDIVFSKPFEGTRLLTKHGFIPVMRPLNQTDEVTLLVRADDPRNELNAFKGGTVVTAAKDNFVYLLGRFLLEQSETALQDMEYLFSGHDIKALQMLLKGQADILFMLTETYRGLSGLSKKMLREIDQSETAFAFHLFSVSPNQADLADKLAEILLNMNADSQGRQVLLDLGMPGWAKPNDDELAMLTLLFNRYAH